MKLPLSEGQFYYGFKEYMKKEQTFSNYIRMYSQEESK